MIRFFPSPVFYELWKHSLAVASTAAKGQVIRLPRFSNPCAFSSYHRVAIPRHFTCGCSVRKDVPQPKTEQPTEKGKIDLDIWKSVMRSQAAADEKQEEDEEEQMGQGAVPGGDCKDSSILEATRELVVMWRQAGKLVPEQMTDDEVQMLAELTTKSSKKKYLKYLALREGHKKARKEKQQHKKAKRAAFLEQTGQSGNIRDGEAEDGHKLKNTFLLQFWDRSLDKLLNWRSAHAMTFGQPLVFDMSYEQNMARREVENTVSQLMEVEGWNRRAIDPFHLHFCNLHPDGAYKHELLKRYSAEAWDRLLITSTDRRHVDVFPREQLVYLTADSPNVLRTFDHSKVYIIGALVDRSIQSGLSMANAKRLKLATARLPLDEFLHWEIGAKNLTLDQMIRILLTLKETGKWEEALQFVPKRKHDGFHQENREKRTNNNSTMDKGVAHHRWRGDGETALKTGHRNADITFRRGDRFLSNSYKDSEFTGVVREKTRDGMAASRSAGLAGDRENKSTVTRLRTSFKSKIEERKNTGKSKKTWREQE
ncbi:tRNA methyltransferase 10 homolog C [Polymixia lowei]